MQIINEISHLKIEDDALLVTAEVSSLYTIIPHALGYQAARYLLIKDQLVDNPTLKFIRLG